MSPEANNGRRVEREARLRWVPIPKMKVSPLAQREINPARVDRIVADFDLEQIGTPTVNLRDGSYYIIDGQHRIEALKAIGWEDQQVQCWTYEELSGQEEAEKFLKLNDTLAVTAHAKFRVGVQADRAVECDIDRLVRAQGLRVSQDKHDGAIGAVGMLRRIYNRSDPGTLSRTLKIIRDAYGDAGLEAPVLDGIALLCQRFNGQLDDDVAVRRLGDAHGGVAGLLGKAHATRLRTGNRQGPCVAAAAVEIINGGRGRGGRRLPSWWDPDIGP